MSLSNNYIRTTQNYRNDINITLKPSTTEKNESKNQCSQWWLIVHYTDEID